MKHDSRIGLRRNLNDFLFIFAVIFSARTWLTTFRYSRGARTDLHGGQIASRHRFVDKTR